MRRRRLLAVAGAVLLVGLVGASPAAAQRGPDHFHLDLSLVRCGTLQASAFELPPSSRLDLRFVNAANGRTLQQQAVTTSDEGTLTLSAELPLTGVRTVRLTVARPGAAKPFAFSELTVPGACPLPFTGPARAPAMAGLALVLLLLGGLLVTGSAYPVRARTAGRSGSPAGPRP